MTDHFSRILRTLIQLAAGGALTALFDQIVTDVPLSVAPYLALIFTLIVTVAQNTAEEMGLIPIVLGPSDDELPPSGPTPSPA